MTALPKDIGAVLTPNEEREKLLAMIRDCETRLAELDRTAREWWLVDFPSGFVVRSEPKPGRIHVREVLE
jgi:hypothetical protein